MQVTDHDLVREAGALIGAVTGRAQAISDRLATYRAAVQASAWRHIGPNRAAENLRRLDAACELARWLLDSTADVGARGADDAEQ
jgi:hypothetical protein